jgi:hypothetical protein
MFNIPSHKEMQIKTTVRFHLIPVRLKLSRKTTTTNAGEDTRKKEPSYIVNVDVN